MFDIHSHIVWGVDDGASSVEVSLQMLAAAAEAGTTDIVATPHWDPHWAYDPELTSERIRELDDVLAGKVRIHRGCEVHLTVDNIEKILENPKPYTINGTQYLLIELPHGSAGRHAEVVLRRLIDEGLSPIIAHPERNLALQRDHKMLEQWVEFGCLLQLTGLSITGGFGGPPKAASAWMLEHGLAHVVASDCHDPEHRSPRLDAAFAAVRSRYGADYAELLFRDNPASIIEGAYVLGGKQTFYDESPRWWKFWERAR